MPATKVVFFQDDDGGVPLLEWLDSLPKKPKAKCIARIQRLRDLGHELRRPEADLLRDGIYELRVGFGGVNYRMLYFFHGQTAAVVSHGCTKERVVPVREIDLAIQRKNKFERAPERHTYEEE
jgi:phage-related protein